MLVSLFKNCIRLINNASLPDTGLTAPETATAIVRNNGIQGEPKKLIPTKLSKNRIKACQWGGIFSLSYLSNNKVGIELTILCVWRRNMWRHQICLWTLETAMVRIASKKMDIFMMTWEQRKIRPYHFAINLRCTRSNYLSLVGDFHKNMPV